MLETRLGTYFAENSCKSEQYTKPNADGVHCILYCRVLLGKIHYTKTTMVGHTRPPQIGTSTEIFDSVVAPTGPMENHAQKVQIHREFIVYDRAQVYPEFAIFYKHPAA